jgi:oligopeptide transport system substrate-binding protein
MLQRFLSTFLFFLLIACSACRGEQRGNVAERVRSGTIVYNLGAEPTSLDPARATRFADLRVVGQLLEGLVRVGGDGRIERAAAESWTVSSDSLTYEFRLRPVRWSNGDPVRAGDFAFAWRRVLDGSARAFMVNLMFDIRGARAYFLAKTPDARARLVLGIETPDDRTIVVRLERPVPHFLSLAAHEVFFPVHEATVARLGEAAFQYPNYISNGAFHLVEHEPRRRIVLEPNQMTDSQRPDREEGLRRIVMVMVENEFTEWTAYRCGEMDVTAGVHRSALATLKTQPDFRSVPLVGTCYLLFNCKQPPFDRPEVRRAFSRALDRRELVEYITRGGERPATGLVAPGIVTARGDFRAEGGDLIPAGGPSQEERKALRAALGSLPKDLTYSFDSNDTMRSLAVALQMSWRQNLGIEVAIQAMPARLLAQSKNKGAFQIARSSWFADYLDPTTFLTLFRSDSDYNPTGWTDPRYDALLDRAAATADPAARLDLLHDAERLLIDEMPVCPVFFYTIAYLERPGLAGIERNVLGRVDFRAAHWAPGSVRSSRFSVSD